MEKIFENQIQRENLKSFQRVSKNSKNSIKYTIALFFNNLKHTNIMHLIMKKKTKTKNKKNIKQVYNIKKNSHFFHIVYIIKSIKLKNY